MAGAVKRLLSSPCHPFGGNCLGNGNMPADEELVREDIGESTVGVGEKYDSWPTA